MPVELSFKRIIAAQILSSSFMPFFFLIILKKIPSSDSVYSESSSETLFIICISENQNKKWYIEQKLQLLKNLHFRIWIIKDPQSFSVNISIYKWVLSFSMHFAVVLCADTSAGQESLQPG